MRDIRDYFYKKTDTNTENNMLPIVSKRNVINNYKPFKHIGVKRILYIIVVACLVVFCAHEAIQVKTLKDQLEKTRQEHTDYVENAPKTKITSLCIRDRLREIGELSTQVYEYSSCRSTKEFRKLLGTKIDIPGTKKEVTIHYSGELKMGYDITEILPQVDNDKKVITIHLPEVQVIDNYVHRTDMKIEGKNNILNPINIEDLTTYFEGYDVEALDNSEYYNIKGKAEERMKLIIENFLAVFPEYTVEFI